MVACICYCLLLALCYCCVNGSNTTDNRITVVLSGLFAYNVSNSGDGGETIANGQLVEIATRLAIKEVASSPSRLNLVLEPFSTECDPARATWTLSQAIKRTQPVVILGPPCEESANDLVSIASRYTNIITVSYASTTPQLNSAAQYRSFFRTVSPFTDLNEALNALLMKFEWSKICIVLQSKPYYNTAAEELGRQWNLTIIEAFPYFNFQYITMDTYCRIFVLLVLPKNLPEIFCVASENGLIGREYQWIILGDTKADDLTVDVSVNCTQVDLMKAIESTLIVSFDETLVSPDFEDRLLQHSLFDTLNVTQHDIFIAASAYDATLSIAFALEAAIDLLIEQGETLEDYLPLNNEHIYETVISSFESLQFNGLLSTIQFSPLKHSTILRRKISQIQSGTVIPIGLFENHILNMTVYGNELQWIGGGDPPKDRPPNIVEDVPEWARILMLVISAFGMALLASFMFVNCYFRENKIIKASSPHVNTLILIGCIFGFVSVVVYTVAADNRVPNLLQSISCNATVWCINIMFTLSFGSLLVKTWRVRAVFHNPWTKRRIYKDYMLFIIILCLLGVDLLLLTLWAIISPVEIHTRTSITASAIIEISHCHLHGYGVYFGAVLVGYKCILLVFGCFLATQTRHIKAKFFNDTKYIVISIYCVSMIVIIGFPIAIFMLLGLYIFISYLSVTIAVIGMSSVISCVVFVPKFVLLYKSRHSQSINMLSTSTKLESTKNKVTEKRPSLASLVLSDYRLSRANSLSDALQLDNLSYGTQTIGGRSSLPTIDENDVTTGICDTQNDDVFNSPQETKLPPRCSDNVHVHVSNVLFTSTPLKDTTILSIPRHDISVTPNSKLKNSKLNKDTNVPSIPSYTISHSHKENRVNFMANITESLHESTSKHDSIVTPPHVIEMYKELHKDYV